jgi:hypothetical protein
LDDEEDKPSPVQEVGNDLAAEEGTALVNLARDAQPMWDHSFDDTEVTPRAESSRPLSYHIQLDVGDFLDIDFSSPGDSLASGEFKFNAIALALQMDADRAMTSRSTLAANPSPALKHRMQDDGDVSDDKESCKRAKRDRFDELGVNQAVHSQERVKRSMRGKCVTPPP